MRHTVSRLNSAFEIQPPQPNDDQKKMNFILPFCVRKEDSIGLKEDTKDNRSSNFRECWNR